MGLGGIFLRKCKVETMRGEVRFEKQIITTGTGWYGGVLELDCTISGSNISFYFSANYSFPAENG